MTVYQKLGNTIRIDADTSPGTGNITVAQCKEGFGGSSGPVFVKVENSNNANVDIFINFSTSNSSVTSTIATVGTPGTGIPVQHGSTSFIQVADGVTPSTVYFAIAAASTTGVYITPVSIIG